MALDFGKLNFSTSFNPTSAFPLDARYYFESKTAADAAAATAEAVGSSNTVYYFGEQIVVVEDSKATIYVIQPKSEGDGGELVEVGSKTLGDDKTITLENGTLSLKDFGKSYYRYVAKTEEAEAHYEKVTGFKAGLQPQISSEDGQLVLAWYEPNPTTVEGLEAEISALSSSVQDITDKISGTGTGEEHQKGLIEKVADLETAVGDEESGLVKDVADLKKEWPVQAIIFTQEQVDFRTDDEGNVTYMGFKDITDEQDKILADLRYSAINIDATVAGLPKGTVYRNGDVTNGYAFLLDLLSDGITGIDNTRMEAVYDHDSRTVSLQMFNVATENYVDSKLNDHLTDPNTLHVTSSEKTAWNAKQDEIAAGDFISIAEDKKTISVDFTGLILNGGDASDWADESEEVTE